ncbi:hypothetical protein Lser_V15G42707 [Lactuca serriola]
MKKNQVPSATNAFVLVIGQNRGKKRKANPQSNRKDKAHAGTSSSGSKSKPNYDILVVSDPKEVTCYYCNEKGHCKLTCRKYLQDLKDGRVKPSSAGTKRK